MYTDQDFNSVLSNHDGVDNIRQQSDFSDQSRDKMVVSNKNTAAENRIMRMLADEEEIPTDLATLVESYRSYSAARVSCISFPVHIDEEMDGVFDRMINLLS